MSLDVSSNHSHLILTINAIVQTLNIRPRLYIILKLIGSFSRFTQKPILTSKSL